MMATRPTAVALTDLVVDLGTSRPLRQRPVAHSHATPHKVFATAGALDRPRMLVRGSTVSQTLSC